MRTVLSVSLNVQRVAVFAELAWMERRPELAALCQNARVQGGLLTTQVIQQTLPGLSATAARNVLESCQVLGLIDKHGQLTLIGDDVAHAQQVPVPEQGVYAFYLTEHPLLGKRILSVERQSSTRDIRFEDIRPLPLVPDAGVIFRSVLDASRFVLRGFPGSTARGAAPEGIVSSTQTQCRLRWTLDFEASTPEKQSYWVLEGKLESGAAASSIEHSPEVAPLDLRRLANAWGEGPLAVYGRWDEAQQRLQVALEGLTEQEQEQFRKSYTLPRVGVFNKGQYEQVSLEDVPIAPLSTAESDRWARKRLVRALARHKGFLSRAALRTLFLSLTEDTPLESSNPTLPGHDALLESLKRVPETFWKLAAPVDLAPFASSPAELAPLQVGTPAELQGESSAHRVGPSPQTIGYTSALEIGSTSSVTMIPSQQGAGLAFSLPYGASWSMRTLVERLLGGATNDAPPQRLLLLDRYVHRPGALRMLELLQETVRASAPGLELDVWTLREEDNFQQVQRITGRPPRELATVFGQQIPHDRYLVIRSEKGEGFAWQMTNSLLHARIGRESTGAVSPEIPLRWRELACIRLKSEQLSNPLKQWLVGGSR